MIEIERKFLVKSDAYKEEAFAQQNISQGYLCSHPERTVRIRIKNSSGYITIKGKGNESGTTRLEWETEIELSEAQALLAICEKGIIKKTRHLIKSGQHTIEVDEFLDENTGLIIAEIELKNENETFLKPDWLGAEVTNDKRFYNSYINQNPFIHWEQIP